MKNVILLTVLLFIGIINVFAQTDDSKVHKEEDGFQWIEFGEGIKTGAKSMNGNIIVEPKCDFVRYQTAKDGNVSIGYFYLVKYKDTELNAICDIKGKVIIPFKYNYANMGVKMCGSDTLIYFCTTNNNFKTSNIYDCTGRKIANEIPRFYIDDNGYICDFNNKKSLNIKIPSANGKLSNFYQRIPTEKVQTPLGWYAIQEKKDEGFNWHLLYTSSLCGAQTVDGKTIVPVEKKCKEINYDNGVFIAKTIDNVYCAYSKDGKELVSTSYNYYNIRVDGYTKTFLYCATKDGNDNYASLHDLNGKLIFPTGTYSDITPKKVNNKIYFIVSKDGKSQVLDYDHNLLISIDSPCFISDVYEDRLGIYYEILQHDIERNTGIIDDKGNVIIATGRYDLIKRVVNDRVAFYETTIVKGDKYSDQEFLNGICDLEGYEVLPNEYDYCPYSATDIFEMKKGGMTYKINIAQLIADAKAQRDRTLAYAHDATNMHNDNQNTADDFEAKRANIAERIDELANKIQDLQAKMDSKRQSTPNTPSASSSSYSQRNTTDSQQKKSYRQQYNDGSYADVTENADGTTTHVTHRKCYSCKGYGKCSICNGMGGLVVGVYTKQWRGCTLCGGSGKCKYCNGTGENVMVQTYYPSTKTAVGLDIYTGKTYQSTYGERHDRNGSSSHSSTSTSSKCSICNGTGIDPHAYYSGDPKPAVGGYTHSSGGKCIYCGKYEWHQHVYCPKCNANKYP